MFILRAAWRKARDKFLKQIVRHFWAFSLSMWKLYMKIYLFAFCVSFVSISRFAFARREMFARQLAIFCVFAIGWDCSEHCIAINIHINLISRVNLRQASGFSLLQLQNGAAVLLAELSTSMNLSIRLIASLCLSLAFVAFPKLFRCWEAISEVQDFRIRPKNCLIVFPTRAFQE